MLAESSNHAAAIAATVGGKGGKPPLGGCGKRRQGSQAPNWWVIPVFFPCPQPRSARYSCEMAKYDPLRLFLQAKTGASVRVTFAQLDDVVGGLPKSARIYREWWANGERAAHPNERAWAAAGFEVDAVDLAREVVVFRRVPPG